MNRRAKWLSRLILAVALFTILPVGEMVVYNGPERSTIATPRDRIEMTKQCEAVIAAAQAKGAEYNAGLYVVDLYKLKNQIDRLDLEPEYNHYIEKLYEMTRQIYMDREYGTGRSPDHFCANYEFNRDFNEAFEEFVRPAIKSGEYPYRRDEDPYIQKWLTVLARWYLQFIPFALMLILLRIEPKKGDVWFRDELGGWSDFLLAVFFWPYGLARYSEYCQKSVHCRYWNLRTRYEAIKKGDRLFYRLSPEEDEKLWAEAETLDNYIDQVARLAKVSRELVEQQSLATVWASAAMSFLIMFFSTGRCLAASKDTSVMTTMVVISKSEELAVNKKPLESSPDVDQLLPSVEHFFCLYAVLPTGWTGFVATAVSLIEVPLIRPPPSPDFPIDHVPWCD